MPVWLVSTPTTRDGECDMAAKFVIYKDAKGEFRFRLKAGNGEVVATGESYPTKQGAKAGIEAVKRAATAATIVDDTD